MRAQGLKRRRTGSSATAASRRSTSQALLRPGMLGMGAALVWASSTLYIKGVLGHRMTALRVMWIRILISTLLLFAISLATEADPLGRMDRMALISLVFQGTVVVFFSYMMWVRLLQVYPASGLQAFTFLSPVWGVLAGIVLLKEALSWPMAGGIALVAAGLILVNQRPRAVRDTAAKHATARDAAAQAGDATPERSG